MKLNQTVARYVASEFAAHLLERAVLRGDLDRFVRVACEVSREGQPASASNAHSAALDLVHFLERRSRRHVESIQDAALVFYELFPAEHTDAERAEMARALAHYLARADCVGEERTKAIAKLDALDEGAR